MAGCGGPDDALSLSDPVQLERSRTVARPALGQENPWLGRTRELTYDPATRRLLGINADEGVAFEMDLDGRLVRQYGRPGQGPGELENPQVLAPAGDSLAILDLGNMKLARFPRTGGPPRESRVSTYYRDLVATERGVLAVPGPDSFALGKLRGGAEEGFGSRAELPAQCRNFCLLATSPGGSVVAIEREATMLVIFSRSGHPVAQIDLARLETMQRWRDEEAEILGQDGFRGGKLWISDAEYAGGGVLLAVLPPRPFDRGRQLWWLDLEEREIQRFVYDRTDAGNDIAVDWPRVFTVSVRDGSILEYRIPESYRSMKD